MTFDYILYDLSYANLVLYSSVLPSYDDEKEDDEIINADDPRNKEKIRKLLYEQ
jgi:hypothetical protein